MMIAMMMIVMIDDNDDSDDSDEYGICDKVVIAMMIAMITIFFS